VAILRAEAAARVLEDADLHPFAEVGLSDFERRAQGQGDVLVGDRENRPRLLARDLLVAERPRDKIAPGK